MGRFWFNGRCCDEFGIVASGEHTYNAPQRDVDALQIPGVNGDLLISNKRYKNISVVYPCGIVHNFASRAEAARAWLLAPQGYCRLEDDYSPNTYRLGYFSGPIDFDMALLNRAGTADLTFTCKPQRYYKIGEAPLRLTAPGALYNFTLFGSLPLIEVTGEGAGSLTVGDCTVEIRALDGTLTLDCELQNACKGTENKNNTIYAPEFPRLTPGANAVSWTGGVTGVSITPRWWTL